MKKTIIIALIVMVLLSFSGCGINSDDLSNQVQSIVQEENEYVLGIKGGCPTGYPDITYGEAFEYFFGYPTWTYFEGSRDEDDTTYKVVEFTGDCMYANAEVKALIQFTISEDNETFEPTYLSFNDVPQNFEVLDALIYKAFSEYQKSAEMESNKATPSD